jgi:hypothetical protein
LKSFEFLHRSQAARGPELANDFVFAPLIMRRRTKASSWGFFQFKAFQVAIKGKIEIEPRLLAVGYDIQPGSKLIKKGCNNSVILNFCAVSLTKLFEMLTGKLQPSRKRIAADH